VKGYCVIDISEWKFSALERCLSLMKGDWVESGLARNLDCVSILANTKNKRVEKLVEQIGKKVVLPPATVVGYRIKRQTFYSVIDGHDRVSACRLCNKKVRAIVTGYHRINTTEFFILKSKLWHKQSKEEWVEVDNLTKTEVSDLKKLGVEEWEN
jgi:uncharacterized ParB-like nuclease family protein